MNYINKNIFIESYKNINPNDYDVFINCTLTKPKFKGKINFRLPVEDNGNYIQNEIMLKLLTENNCILFKILDKLIERNKKCCIFCNKGRQRSPTVYACYLIYKGLDMNMSLRHIYSIKKDAFLGNINFKDTIKQFDKYLKNNKNNQYNQNNKQQIKDQESFHQPSVIA